VSVTSVYVHIPFCTYKCTYCDFAAYAGELHLADAYLEALLAELALAQPLLRQTRLSTVFFGGGTPSSMAPDALARILQALDYAAPLTADAEISLEANPDSLSPASLSALRRAGFTRISIGVQTLNSALLTTLHRGHDANQALQALAWAHDAGFSSVNADLIFGLPGQDINDWLDSLDRLTACAPHHLSLYGLQVEQGALLPWQLQRGLLTLPSDDTSAAMYEEARPRLAALGYEQYEISNWARPGHRCRHNLVYWHHDPYLGLGLAAHSYVHGRRSANVRGLRHYLSRLQRGLAPTHRSESIDLARARQDALILGLRLVEGVSITAFDARFGGSLRADYREPIERFTTLALLEAVGDRLRLTPRAYLLANQIWQEFL
jgi:oxygen-independent coproporphyrinogen-3 oxidase